MSTENIDSWRYWRDKYGYVGALEVYYPELLQKNIQLQIALAQIKNSKIIIDAVMEELNT